MNLNANTYIFQLTEIKSNDLHCFFILFKYIHTYTHTHTHIYIYIYIYLLMNRNQISEF